MILRTQITYVCKQSVKALLETKIKETIIEDGILSMNQVVLDTLGLILIVGILLISVNDFVQDKISFYQIKNIVKNSNIDKAQGNEKLFSMKTKTFELTQLNRISTNMEKYDLARYNGTILKIKNLTNNTCKIEKSFFKQLFDKYDSIEIQNTILRPTEETLVYIAFKGYHTKSTNHTSLLMLDQYSSLPKEFLPYARINQLLTYEYTSLKWELSPERITRLEKESSNSIYASVDLQKILSLKEGLTNRTLLAGLMFHSVYCKNNANNKTPSVQIDMLDIWL